MSVRKDFLWFTERIIIRISMGRKYRISWCRIPRPFR
nr:MAG TPA: hypothetical protein [Caudoviricetes sp.]